MIDLRNKQLLKLSNIKTKPEQSKNSNFHFALADYIYKELRKKGIEVKRKNDLSLQIYVGGTENKKYSSLLIDCLDGNIYAVNVDNKEKKIGRLISFKGQRASDAFHCMKKSIEKIIKKVSLYSLLNDIEVLEKKAKLDRLDFRNR